MMNTIGPENIFSLIDLQKSKAKFDQDRDLQKTLNETKILAQSIIRNQEPLNRKDLKINGNDLINLGIKGKAIKEVLDALLIEVYKFPEKNTREELLTLANNYAKTYLT